MFLITTNAIEQLYLFEKNKNMIYDSEEKTF